MLLHNKLCKLYRFYCLNYILNKSQVYTKNANFVTSLLRCNKLFLDWVHEMKYFETHCKLLKFIIRDMLFPTKLTSLINTRGLIDSASLENHRNNRRNSGSHKWPKTFFGWCITHEIYRGKWFIPVTKHCRCRQLQNSNKLYPGAFVWFLTKLFVGVTYEIQ